jgi:NADPH-dependent glutamate synthase beta subunit-like oxidoreductase
MGAHKSQKMGISGEDEGLEGMYFGIDFLRDTKLGNPVKVGNKVAVIGGGNTAMDAARSALRLGAKEVNVYYRRSREEMPVSSEEYEEALEEGIKIHFLVTPVEIMGIAGRVTGMKCLRMKLGEPDESGRKRPAPLPGSEFIVGADMVIPAIGQNVDMSFSPPYDNVTKTKWGTFVVDKNTLATNVPGVFAGGDCVSGPWMAIHAIAAGRRAAMGIHKFLRGDASRVDLSEKRTDSARDILPTDEETAEKKRTPMPVASPEARAKDFSEIELGFSEKAAREEAKRCLRCDLAK